MRALLLHITLKYEPKYCPKELQLLASKLPPETRRVWYGSGEDSKTMCFLVPQMELPSIWIPKLRSTLAAFEDWTLTQIGPLSASKYGSACPFETWMDNNVRVGEIRKPSKSKHVPLTQRWKIGA